VDFASPEEQKKAIELTGTDLYGRELNITPSNSRSGGGDRGRGRGGARGGGRGGGQRTPNRERNPPSNTLFVKNLSFGTTEDTLYEHFDGASRIRIITDRESGESRG
jgi:nucleolin